MDRRAAVIASNVYNGIDFVAVADASETTLVVHFLNAVPVVPLQATPTISGGERITDVPVLPVASTDWGWDEEHITLTLRVAAPGDFSTYTLAVPSNVLDQYFDRVAFSFKANCPSDFDCAAVTPPCPPAQANVPPIDYLAKDFLSFRQALLDFSALRYPQWQERSEADFGMMFLEALSSLADDLSYTQDRIAAEAALATATQRRSVVRHARLVDYEPGRATSANVLLRFDVANGVTQIPYGVPVNACAPDGTVIPFETGTGLAARMLDAKGNLRSAPPTVPANSNWNAGQIFPYWFDDSRRCLPAGATHMHVHGHNFAFQAGQQLLIETQAATTADPPIRQIVTLLAPADPAGPWAIEEYDPLFFDSPPSPLGTPITRIAWQPSDALTNARDLTKTTLAGNVIAATQGATIVGEAFVTTAAPAGDPTPPTIVRTGARPTNPDGTPGTPPAIQLYTLANAPLAWLPQTASDRSVSALPEIILQQDVRSGSPTVWSSVESLLKAGASDTSFTIDPVRYSPLAQNSDGSRQYDYDGDAGDTIRFGDGVFGLNPDAGTRFGVTYRLGAGAAGNVAADAITSIDAAAAAQLLSATNPLPASGGADAQALESVRRLAPQAFRNELLRAVLPADYAAAAQQLPWVENAGAVFRWTGSWLTVFTTPQAVGSETVSVQQSTQLIDLLNRYRMAGYESYVPAPRFLSIDLAIDVCAQPTAFAGDVQSAVVAALSPAGAPAGPPGFFAVGAFTFGQALRRSALEAVIQRLAGVAGVLCIRVRVRGQTAGFVEMSDTIAVAFDQILRCDNDPSFPEHGSLRATVLGGR